MRRWADWFGKFRRQPTILEEHVHLLDELQKAKDEWIVAVERLEYVVGHEQIDYAIYLLEAAEKRYDMLLRHAKRIGLRAQIDPGQTVGEAHQATEKNGGA